MMRHSQFIMRAVAIWGSVVVLTGVTARAFEVPTSNRGPIAAQRPVVKADVSTPRPEKQVADGADEFKPASSRPSGATSTTAVGGTAEWLKDPFRHLASDMADVVADLGKEETHVPATQTQPRVLSRLDVLVEMLEKACKKGGGGAAGANPTRPADVSTLGGGPGGRGPLRNPDQSRKNWASLTPKEREKVLQSQSQGFPPGYEDLLAEYFRRLAQGETPAEMKASGEKSSGPAGR